MKTKRKVILLIQEGRANFMSRLSSHSRGDGNCIFDFDLTGPPHYFVYVRSRVEPYIKEGCVSCQK